jgi:hypothetical protein
LPYSPFAGGFYAGSESEKLDSLDWEGKVVKVHERAMNPDTQSECYLNERQVDVLFA